MSIHPTLTRGSIADAVSLRDQADALLQRLLADRESSEQRLASAGKRDPLKTVTGATALERAICSTREMIAQMDLMLADLDGNLHPQAQTHPAASIASPRPATPNRHRSGGMLFGKRPVAAPA